MNRSADHHPMLLTSNEIAWIGFIRLIGNGGDPVPTLKAVQSLREALRDQKISSLCDLRGPSRYNKVITTT